MKNIINFIKETKSSDYNEEEYRKSYKHKIYNILANNYLEILGKEKIAESVQNAINETNKILDIFQENNISGFINGQMLGRIIERKLAESIGNIKTSEGIFEFVQGSEGSDEKDIHCKSKPNSFNLNKLIKNIDNIPDNIKDHFIESKDFGIELKCSQGTGITGNKSYALDVDGKKGKQAFYILINYNAPGKISTTVNAQTEKEVNSNIDIKFHINGYDAYFGFIEQEDWIYGEKGNAASLKMNVLRSNNDNTRLIPLNKTRKNK